MRLALAVAVGCAGGLSPGLGFWPSLQEGYTRSLNQCCPWPCVVGARHNSSLPGQICPGRRDAGGGLRDETGEPGVSPALRGLRGARAGSAALPTLGFASLLSPCSLQSQGEGLGVLWAWLKGCGRCVGAAVG